MPISKYQGDGSINVLRVDTFVNADGWNVERLVMDVKGHNVQILRYDGDDRAVVVFVDEDAKQMPLARANGYIRNRT